MSQLYENHGEVDALGLMIQLSGPTFVLTALMLIDMLSIMKPLTLWLQSSPAAIDITQLPVIVGNVVDKLNYSGMTLFLPTL